MTLHEETQWGVSKEDTWPLTSGHHRYIFKFLCQHLYTCVYLTLWNKHLFFLDFISMFMNVCLHVCMHTTCVPGSLQRSEEGIGYCRTGVRNGCKLPRGCWKPNPSPLKEQVLFFVFNKCIYSFILHPGHSFSFLLSSQSLSINSLCYHHPIHSLTGPESYQRVIDYLH